MRWWSGLLVLLLWGLPAYAQPLASTAGQLPFAVTDLNPGHPHAQGLVLWTPILPHLFGGPTWWNVVQPFHGTLTNMGAPSGFQPSVRDTSRGEMRFDGTDDYVDFGNLAAWDFPNTTFTVMGWFRATGTTTSYLVAKRGNAGAWFIRLDNPGTLTARIDGASNPAAARTSVTATLLDGTWRHFAVVFTTDTGTAANNNITIYINGVLDQGSLTGALDVYGTNGANLVFGCFHNGTACQAGNYLTGGLEDIRIYSRGIAAVEAPGFAQSTPPGFGGLVDAPSLLAVAPAATTQRGTFFQFFP